MDPRPTLPFELEPSSHWQPWPSCEPVELRLAAAIDETQPLVVLPGNENAGDAGRFGLVAVPSNIQRLHTKVELLRAQLSPPPAGCLRVVLLGYELGACFVHLELASPPPEQAYGYILDIKSGWVSDHRSRKYCSVGQASMPGALGELSSDPGNARLHALVNDEVHGRRIEKTQEHIQHGTIYQANIARPLSVAGIVNPLASLHQLITSGALAHSAYLRVGKFHLLSGSMETLLRYNSTTRMAKSFPIKGTRRDAQQLRTHPKEQAEHVMIVDLVRNDLGRVCRAGTVEVAELMGIHSFPGLSHGISEVRGELRQDQDIFDLIRALFPGGSITGAPNRRAIQIIRELEQQSRGFYTGSLGYITSSGSAHLSILIRTLVGQCGDGGSDGDSDGDRAQHCQWRLWVGGGIVADSIVKREIVETWEKVGVFEKLWRHELAKDERARPDSISNRRPRGM